MYVYNVYYIHVQWHIAILTRMCLCHISLGTRWRSSLSHCATSWKVTGSIPDGFIGILLWPNTCARIIAVGSTQRSVGLTTLPPSCADYLEIWDPQFPGTLRACTGIVCYLYIVFPENRVGLKETLLFFHIKNNIQRLFFFLFATKKLCGSIYAKITVCCTVYFKVLET